MWRMYYLKQVPAVIDLYRAELDTFRIEQHKEIDQLLMFGIQLGSIYWNLSSSSNSGETTSTVHENHDIGSCSACGLLTGQYCKRCGDYYCSTECQSIDWPKHRYICFPNPPLVRAGSVFAEGVVFPVEHPREVEGYSLILKELNDFKKEIMKKLTELVLPENENAVNKTTTATTSWETQYIVENLDDCPKPDENPKDISTNDEISYSSVNDEINTQEEVSKYDLNTSYVNQSQQFDMTDTINSIDDKNESPCLIVLCAFQSTNRCAIRKKDSETTKIYDEILEKIHNYGKTAPLMQEMPAAGSYAITFKMMNLYTRTYTRVRVIKPENENKIWVRFCDYGNTVCRKLSELHVITPEISNLPKCVRTVQLYGVNMTEINKKTMDYLKTFEKKDFKMEYIYMNDDNINHVKLYDITTGELLNYVIAQFFEEYEKLSIVNTTKEKRRILNGDLSSCCDENKKTLISDTCFVESKTEKVVNEPVIQTKKNDIPKPSNALQSNINKNSEEENQHQNVKKKITNKEVVSIKQPPFQQHPFSDGWTNIQAVIVDISAIVNGYIACIPKGDLEHLSSVQGFLNKIDYKNEPYEPRLNEYCVAQFENEWYRGLVVDIVDDGDGSIYKISYIDFMNEAVLTSQYIRPYPEDLQIGCYTSLCKFDNLPKALNDKHREFLKSAFDPNDIIIIDRVVEVITDNNVAVIECNDIISRMMEKDLI